MKMGNIIVEIGIMIFLMAMEFIAHYSLMLTIRDNGFKDRNMGRVLSMLKMAQNILENLYMDKKKDKENSYIQIEPNTKEILKAINLMALACTKERDTLIQENGNKVKCMDQAIANGIIKTIKLSESTLDNIKMG